MITTCPRCNGTGAHSYNPLDGSVCFQCRGKRVIEVAASQVAQVEQKREANAAKNAARQARVEKAQSQAREGFRKQVAKLEAKLENCQRQGITHYAEDLQSQISAIRAHEARHLDWLKGTVR